MMRPPISNKPGLLTLTIKDKSALYLAYMPFVRNGGLFVPTNSNYRLGDEVFMLLNLMGEEEKLPVAGKVIWVTPRGAQGKRVAGIGVQFSEQDRGATVVDARQGWIAVEFRSRVFGFIDDLRFELDPATGVFHVQSASRLGYWDLGVNRRRVEALRAKFNAGEPAPVGQGR